MYRKASENQSKDELSVHQNLEDAVCLLALIAQRHDPQHGHPGEEKDVPDGIEEVQVLSELDVELEEPDHLAKLRDKLLDGLAEILARFKHDKGRGGALDAKHVASVMMICDESENRVKFICAKNQGLDEKDMIFLDGWKSSIEVISAKRSASNSEKNDMFELVFNHQRPRIQTYVQLLKNAFRSSRSIKAQPATEARGVMSISEGLQPLQVGKRWQDVNGLLYEFPAPNMRGVFEDNVQSDPTNRSFVSSDLNVSELFDQIRLICAATRETEDTLLKDLMRDTLKIWKDARTRSNMKTHLNRYFENDSKHRKEAEKALLFLCRIFHSVCIFIDAAERLPGLALVECVGIAPRQFVPFTPSSAPCSPQLAAKRIGLKIGDSPAWSGFFNRKEIQFSHLVKERRAHHYLHAEIQALYFYNMSCALREKQLMHKYIGCSRLCCPLCYQLIRCHNTFRVRGTHGTVIHRWGLPVLSALNRDSSPSELCKAVEAFLAKAKEDVQSLLNSSRPPISLEVMPQSVDGLSSAQIQTDKVSAPVERSIREREQMMMMPTVANGSLLVVRDSQRPERASVSGGQFRQPKEMSMSEAELMKSGSIREALGLEPMDEMPTSQKRIRKCNSCHQPSSKRCAACRMSYCSRRCQAMSWVKHVFVCCVSNRPNDIDHLRLMCRKWRLAMLDRVKKAAIVETLLQDPDFCKRFGFYKNFDEAEIRNLMCIYIQLTRQFRPSVLQESLNCENFGRLVHAFVENVSQNSHVHEDGSHCISWYRQKYQREFNTADPGDLYFNGRHSLSHGLSVSEKSVVRLYSTLLRSAGNNIPDATTPEWINFGFCYCSDFAQRKCLANAFLTLLNSDVSFTEIAMAWESSTLAATMLDHDIDITHLEAQGIKPQRPNWEDIGIYRFIAEIKHVLSGSYCACFQHACPNHSKYETVLSMESEVDYGFHGTNPWERWQLMNFYSYVFEQPGFDARRMQEARRDQDPGALEKYLESLVPDFQRKIWDEHLADAMFPKLKSRLSFRRGRPECGCVIHSVCRPQP